MGNTPGQPSRDDPVASLRDLSGPEGLPAREAAASWFRPGVAITDVYEVVGILGQGHMGEVFEARRRTAGHHTDRTRNAQLAHERTVGEVDRDRRRPTVRSAAHKATKELKKAAGRRSGCCGGSGLVPREDENSNLAPFIGATDDGPHQPPDADGVPPKSIMKATAPSGGDGDPCGTDGAAEGGRIVARPSLRRNTNSVHFQRTFAVKTILTSRIDKNQLPELVNEIKIMRKLDHPNVLKLYEVYHVKRKVWLVTDLLRGGNLSSRKLDERDGMHVVTQVLRALVYLHRMGVVHRDLKLENVLYESPGELAVRLIDFGLSQTFDRTAIAATYTRTQYTMSPEAAAGKAAGGAPRTVKADVWALGVIAFVLLSGEFPFVKTTADLKDSEKMEALKQAKVRFGITWKGRRISEKAKEFVKGCLQRDPNERWTAHQALENLQQSWAPIVDEIWDKQQTRIKERMSPEYILQQEVDGSDSENTAASQSSLPTGNDDHNSAPSRDPQARAQHIKMHVQKVVREKNAEAPISANETAQIDVNEVERYANFGLLKKTILITMSNTMDRGDVVKLNELFLELDTKDTGTITLEELIASFHKVSPDLDEKRATKLFSSMDRDNSGQIHYAEFLAALAESHGLVTLDRLSEAFDRLDTDGKGYITHGDLKHILGKDYDKETVDKMIEEGDFKKNNKIDYEELLQVMFSDPVKGAAIAGSVSPRASADDD